VLLLERHKANRKPNTIIITKVTAVTSVKHSDSDTEPAYFMIINNLYITKPLRQAQSELCSVELVKKR
jgi:hypothetical protein